MRGVRVVGWIAVVVAALATGVPAAQGPGASRGGEPVVANVRSRTYHRPECSVLARSSAANQARLASGSVALASGFRACRTCRPGPNAESAFAAVFRAQARQAPASKKSRGQEKAAGPDAGATTTPAADAPSFRRDVAPILAGNCLGCHNPQDKGKRNNLDLTTFATLTRGGDSGPPIVPGEPGQSLLLKRLRGEEGLRKMPPGNNRTIADEAIAKIEAWIQAGARLDAGLDPTANLREIAPTPEDLRRAELAKLSPAERDRRLEEVARQRWKKASSRVTPRMTSGEHFALFGNLPEPRARQALEAMENERALILELLGPESAPTLAGPEKVSLYVFNDQNAYAEFVRSVESREHDEDGPQAHGRLDVEAPYVVAVDPLAGRDDPNLGRKPTRGGRGRSRSKKQADAPSGPDRTLPGLLSEALVSTSVSAAGQAPHWLTLGLGAYLAQMAEGNRPYYGRLRDTVMEQGRLGWMTKANQALGNEAPEDVTRALGYSLVDWLASAARPIFPDFVRAMLGGQEQLDTTIRQAFGPDASRDGFLNAWGTWVAANYSQSR